MLAISTDPSDESAKFATKYGIRFPLLADLDGAVSKQFVGVNYDDTTIPGIVVVRRDGTIAFRQVASSKDDRLSSAELLATLDRTLGTRGQGARQGYAVFERIQLHLDAGGGGRHDPADGTHAIPVASFGVLVPLARQLMIGPWLSTELTSVTGVDLAVVGRLPLLHDSGAIQITTTIGWSPTGDASWNAGARIGPWLALTPSWALHLDLGGTVRGQRDRDVFGTLGLTYLLGPR